MPEQESWKQRLQPKIAGQVDYIATEFHRAEIEIGLATANGGVGFMHAEDQLLVRSEYLQQVLPILERHFHVDRCEHVVSGVELAHLRPKASREPLPELPEVFTPKPLRARQHTVIHVLEQIAMEVGERAAAPNHLLTVASPPRPVIGPCPATEPEQVYDGTEPYPGICTTNSGAGVLVYIADTGLLEGADAEHPWLHGVERAREPDGTFQNFDSLGPAGSNDVPTIPPYAGHGTFVAGVVRCVAPQADVIVSNIFKVAGSAFESDFVKELDRALKLGVDVFNLSITSPTWRDLRLLGFGGWLRHLRRYKGVVCIVAVGNHGSRRPSWPAVFPEMVSVGALAADWRSRASFSNHGGWVDVYAPGRGLVNAYATGTYTCQDDPYRGEVRNFYGMARWSGTSFSTPIVTGLVAARMSRTGENGLQAAAALLRKARAQAIPGVGAVLLPCRDDDDAGACCACQCHRAHGCGPIAD